MFHQIFKVCIVKPLILFIFKDTTYVFYPKGRKEISVWKIPIITNTQLSRKWTEIGSTLPICRRVGFIKLARDFSTLQRALRGWEKPCRALYGHLQMSWLCAQASLSVLQCLVLTLPSLHTRHPRHSCTSPQDMLWDDFPPYPITALWSFLSNGFNSWCWAVLLLWLLCGQM